MNIIAFFTEDGTPKTGLSAVIDIWELDGTHTVNNQAMTEVAGGFYYYSFASYADTTDYCIRADGSNVLSDTERYVATSNELGQVTDPVDTIKSIEGGKWVRSGATMFFYDEDNVTSVCSFDLYDEDGVLADNDSRVFRRDRR